MNVWNWAGKTILSRGELRLGASHKLETMDGVQLGSMVYQDLKRLMTFQGVTRLSKVEQGKTIESILAR